MENANMLPDYKSLIHLLKGKKTYLQMHNFPDPDAIGSAFGMQEFLKYYGVETEICYDGAIEKMSGRNMIDMLGIKVKHHTDCKEMCETDYIVTIDGQKYNSNFTDLIGDEVACIDHHPTFIDCEYHYKDVRIVGACASIVTWYYVASGTPMSKETATALLYGLRMDTESLNRGVTPFDIEMFGYLFARADNQLISILYRNTMEIDDLKAYGAAIKNVHVQDCIGFAYIPFDCQDALVAMISDFLLAIQEIDYTVIYAKRNGGYKFSVRCMREDVHAGKWTKSALEGIGDGGGHAIMAGGAIPKSMADSIIEKKIESIVEERFVRSKKHMIF